MNVMVTGGRGLIGSQAAAQLKAAGHTVVMYDLKNGQDIGSPRALRKFVTAHKPEVVVHLAAWPHPSTSLTFRHYLDNNVMGTFNVAEACAEAKVSRLVYSSSTAYYGYEHSVGRPLPIGDEETIPGVRWAQPAAGKYLPCELWYGISKVCAETVLAYYGLHQVCQVVILRFCPVPHHIDLGLSPEKAGEAIRLAVEHEGELWYEVFNVAGTPGVDISKAIRVLGYDPETKAQNEAQSG